MKTILFSLVFLLGFVCVFPVFSQIELSRDEVIEEAARLTGLAKDSMELLYEEAPGLFVNVERAAFTVKMLHLFASARNEEAILELFNRSVDNLRPMLFPGPLNTFITAVKVYKTSLEIIRDYVFIPKLDDSIYQGYRYARLADLKQRDTSTESILMSFERATTSKFSGYYAVQEKMYQELLKRKGYREESLDATTKERLRSQIDRFWMSVLELRLQQEILAQNERAIAATCWREIQDDLAYLREEALRMTSRPTPGSEDTTATSTPGEEEEAHDALTAFRSLYPEYLRWYYRSTPSSRVEILANAEATGDGKYRLAYRLWQTIQDGPRKGEEVVAVSFEAIRTLGELESSLKSMRESLGKKE
ncbi:MAG: hypothetical protein N2205_05560 [Candidatus Caldatribacterium sp.]|nr:hypothetical protein [Candidatus Caldatribacterium sp.]